MGNQTQDNPNELGSFSIKEISIIIAVISIAITMFAATSIIIIVGFNLDWSDPKNQAVGLELMNQVGIMFSAIGHSSLLLIGLGAGGGLAMAGVAIGTRNKNKGPEV